MSFAGEIIKEDTMSILIPGKMPLNGEVIVIRPNGQATLYARGDVAFIDDPKRIYKTIELPPHGRLIDADADPSKYVTVWDCDCSEFGKQTVMAVDDLNYLPAVIPADREEDT